MTESQTYRAQIAGSVETERWGVPDAVGGLVGTYLLNSLIGAVIVTAAGWKAITDIPMWGFGVVQIPLWAGYVGAAVLAARKGSGVQKSFGLVFRRLDAPIGLAIGILCQLVVRALYIPILRLTGTDAEELSRPAKELASGAQSLWSWALFALLVGLVAPVVEELFFRGLLLRSLSKYGLSVSNAVFISSFIFAGVHLQLLQLPGLLLFGVVLAVVAVVSGRLGPAIFAHIGFNATTVVVLYLQYRAQIR